MAMNDWATRKMAIDVIYTLAAILKEVLIPFKSEILEVLNHSRFDKYKPVREATIEAYQTIKNLGGDDGVEESYEEPSKVKNRSSLRDTIRQAKSKPKAKQDTSIEIYDKSDNDKKLSNATQKRIESKRAAMEEEEKKDTGPISYDDVKSNIKKMPKNSNFFKKQKVEKKNTIEIFTSGDHKKFDYEDDLRKHREAEAKARKNKPKEPDFGVQIYEGKKPETSKHDDYEPVYSHEDRKVRDDDRPIHSTGVKDPDDVPVQIYVKGKPHRNIEDSSSRRANEETAKKQKISSKLSPKDGGRDTNLRTFDEEELELKGQEYENSMNLLKQHQEIMKSKDNIHKIERNAEFEFVGRRDSREEQERRNNLKHNLYLQSQYRIQNYQPTYQPPPYNPANDLVLQKKIESFTQQMATSMANLQNYVRSEMAGVKQRISYIESKVESISRRQNELELDRINQNNINRSLEAPPNLLSNPTPITEAFAIPTFERETYTVPTYTESERVRITSTDDDWSQALAYVQQEETNMAYSLVLDKRDDMLLFKLMGRTGVCFNKLDPDNTERIIKVINSTLSSKTFIDLLLPWVTNLCRQFNQLHPVVKKLSLTKGLENSLFVLMTDTLDYLDSNQKNDVERMYAFVKSHNDDSS